MILLYHLLSNNGFFIRVLKSLTGRVVSGLTLKKFDQFLVENSHNYSNIYEFMESNLAIQRVTFMHLLEITNA